MWDLIVSVPDHCLSFYSDQTLSLRWAHTHFVGFVMRWHNICTVPLLTNFKVNFSYQLEKFLYGQNNNEDAPPAQPQLLA